MPKRRGSETDGLLEEEEQGCKKYASRDSLLLLFYVVMAILVGTTNRVLFKLMQYSMINYSYCMSQLTTLIYLPIYFTVIMVKLACTNHITPEMLKYPKWKFMVMGLFDSLQGILMVVGGIHVPGMMQNLLLQGSVPVTMLFSLLMLRNRGDNTAKTVRQALIERGISFTEERADDDEIERAKSKGESVCRVEVNGREIGFVREVIQKQGVAEDEDIFGVFFKWVFCCGCKDAKKKNLNTSLGNVQSDSFTMFSGEDLTGDVVLITDASSWKIHLRTYFSIAQYLGAVVVLCGLVTSVWPDINGVTGGGGGGEIYGYFVFFSSTIPIAVSAIYKQIAFSSADLDIWYINGYVAFPQFIIGISYAPLAAVMSGLAIDQIPTNLWHGIQCLAGTNFITRANGYDCSEELDCGINGNPQCCDSCDGSIPNVSSIPAIWGVVGYMIANITYNVFLMLVVKHGSAALLYASGTLILPLTATAFTVHAFLGDHAKAFNVFTGAGLGIVLFGLIIYRFADLFISIMCPKRKTH